MNHAPVTSSVIEELQAICGTNHVVFDDEKILKKYSRDQVPEDKYAHLPEVVVMPRRAPEIAAIMKLANREKIPVTPRAAGSGLSGGAVPIHGGILLSIERMNAILEIDTSNLMAVVEPGVVTNQLDAALKPHGLFFAGYPMSEEFCFIGGNVAENAGGGRAIKYGVTGRYIRGLEVVTPTGDIVQLGGKRVKDVTGYDLVSLMVGSEGTHGNLHATPMKNPEHTLEQWERMLPELLRDIYRATARLGGTISGEHGIGHKRRDFLALVMEGAQLDMMRQIRRALDPKNILNLGESGGRVNRAEWIQVHYGEGRTDEQSSGDCHHCRRGNTGRPDCHAGGQRGLSGGGV